METNKTNVDTVESGISTLSAADGTKTEFSNTNCSGLFQYETVEEQEDMTDYYSTMLKVQHTPLDSRYFWATLTIYLSKLNLGTNAASVQLQLVSKENAKGSFKINSEIFDSLPNHTYTINLTQFIGVKNSVTLNFEHAYDEETNVEFYTTGDNMPKIIVKSVSSSEIAADRKILQVKRYYKSFDLPNGVMFNSELAWGNSALSFCDFSADKSLLNSGISHIFLGGGANIGYGKGFALNLSERITTVDYISYYVDALGDYYRIKNAGYLENTNGNYKHTKIKPKFEPELLWEDENCWPTQWLTDNKIAKGFNNDGYLMIVSDTYGNYCKLTYDDKYRITELVSANKTNHTIFEKDKFTFTYDSNGNLSKISSDNKGSVEYSYTGNDLTEIKYQSGLKLTITYLMNKISAVKSSEGYNSRFTYDLKSLNIIVESTLNKIPDGQTGTASELQKYTIANNANLRLQNGEGFVTVINDEEYYGFTANGSIYSYTLEQNSKVVKAEQYNTSLSITKKSDPSKLNATPFREFIFAEGEKSETDYVHNTKLPQTTTVTNVPLSDGTSSDYTIYYTYNDYGLCTKEQCNITYNLSYNNKKSYTKITEYEYNDKYMPVKKTSYVSGEEAKYGKVIEEYSYDGHGNLTETVAYNSKTETQKFRTKKEYDSYDRLIKEYDETGDSYVEYLYKGYSDKVSHVAVTETAGYAEHTKENGVLAFETTEDQEDMSDYYDNILKIQSKPYDSRTFFARIDVNMRGKYFYEDVQTAELELHSKGNAKGEFSIGTEIYEAIPNHTYRIDVTEKLKAQKNIALWLYNAANDTEIEFYTSGPEQPKLIISTRRQRLNYGYDNSDRVTTVTATGDAGSKLVNNIEYTYGEVTKLADNSSLSVETEYDNKRRISKTKVGGNDIESVVYSENTLNGITTKRAQLTYKNGAVYNASITTDGKVITADNYRAEYNADGSISKEIETDKVTGKVTDEITYTYDNLGRIKKAETKKNNVLKQTTQYAYDDYGKLTSIERSGDGFEGKYYYYTDSFARRLSSEVIQDKVSIFYKYDTQGRISEKAFQTAEDCTGIDTQYITYSIYGNNATNRPSRLTYSGGNYVSYYYNAAGNISSIHANDYSCIYGYDKFGRLTEEYNSKFGYKRGYEYDKYGNITKVTEYDIESDEDVGSYTITYNKDRLTSFKGQQCVYDSIGNPTLYRGYTATWNGRQLTNYKGIMFTYDGRGRRISKGGITFTYDCEGNLIKQSNGLKFFYDCQGVTGFEYNNDIYCYRKDAQGNIIAILDSNGNAVVKYYYDAWGNQIVSGSNTALGNLNPFRYRSYYYDTETGFYFLQTRYYDPEVGRFLNMDSTNYADPETVHGLNLYVYCGNNPVMNVDPNGNAWWNWLISIGSIVGGIALSFVPGGQGLGAALFVSGISMTASNIMTACGASGKTASIVSSCLDIIGGIALCFTPFAGLGASFIGSGVGGLAGGFISEGFGKSFELGAMIGSIAGSIIGANIYKEIKISQLARAGSVVIGEGMNRVNTVAQATGAATYGGMPGFKALSHILPSSIVNQLGLAHNAGWIRWVAKSGVGIIDIGPIGKNSPNYLMEILYIMKWLF